jgi:hypothetical protein
MHVGRAARIAELLEAIRREVADELAAQAGESGPRPRPRPGPGSGAAGWAELVRAVDRVERVGHGLLLQVLARAGEARAVPGGVGPWLTAQFGYAPGRARAVAQDARRIGTLPQLTEKLSCGELPVGAPRVLARAVHAVRGITQDPAQAVADTLTALERGGMQQAEAQVRTLEHTVEPGRAENLQSRQRSRSFARIGEGADGMVRLDVLLDAERGTLLRTALDAQVSGWMRARQYDKVDPIGPDITTTEQMNAEAVARLADLYLSATDAQRAERYSPTVLYYAPAPTANTTSEQKPAAELGTATGQESAATSPNLNPTPAPTRALIPAGCVETAYGAWIPGPSRATMQDPALHLTISPHGDPTALDGQPIDRDPTARLASPAQRVALAWRDRHCTHPGCTRPTTWSLHGHHRTAYADSGVTTLANLTLLCPEHHTLAHHPTAA